jgi:hypothetical protein
VEKKILDKRFEKHFENRSERVFEKGFETGFENSVCGKNVWKEDLGEKIQKKKRLNG